MKQREDDIPDMQQLADEGWQQMKELLHKEGLSDVKPIPFFNLRKLFILAAIAACLLTYIIIFNPFQSGKTANNLADALPVNINNPREDQNSALPFSPVNKTKKLSADSQISVSGFKKIDLNSPHLVWIAPTKNDPKYLDSLVHNSLKKKHNITSAENIFENQLKINSTSEPALPEERIIPDVKEKQVQKTFSKKVKWYVGAGSNIISNNGDVDFSKLNIHPSLRVAIPLNKNFSLHTGLYAMSVVHGKEVSSQDKELVNNFVSNLLYKINTTSIIKAAYFDVPLTLNYHLSENWSIGAGVQLSKLYKVNVKEKKDSYDYDNSLVETTISLYNSNPARAAAAFHKKVAIKKMEPLLMLEAGFHKGPWLISAGYYYGATRSITLQQPDGTRDHFRNQYIKLGVQYQLGRK